MYNIALIPGDGIGPEIIREGKKVIEIASKFIKYNLDEQHSDRCLVWLGRKLPKLSSRVQIPAVAPFPFRQVYRHIITSH